MAIEVHRIIVTTVVHLMSSSSEPSFLAGRVHRTESDGIRTGALARGKHEPPCWAHLWPRAERAPNLQSSLDREVPRQTLPAVLPVPDRVRGLVDGDCAQVAVPSAAGELTNRIERERGKEHEAGLSARQVLRTDVP